MRNKIDLLETYDGDLVVRNGDFVDTSNNTELTYYQMVKLLLNTFQDDFVLLPGFGVNFNPFLGERNTKELGYTIARYIKDMVQEKTVLFSSEMEVIPFPLNAETIAFQIRLFNSDTKMIVAYSNTDNFVDALKIRGSGINRIPKKETRFFYQ